ncbi:transposase [Singulisphaera rosea]
MAMARAHVVDSTVTRWYQCVTRCVRLAFLLGDPEHGRKDWVDQRLNEFAEIFEVSVAAFSVMDNHRHVLVRLDPDVAGGWTDEEFVRRWGQFFPPRDRSRKPLPVSDQWVQGRLADAVWVAISRRRLQSLSWFTRFLKEPLSRLANSQDGCRGAFFEARFKRAGILDEESLLATCAYSELNPVAAGLVDVPDTSPHTSIKERVEHVKEQDRREGLEASRGDSVAESEASTGLEVARWLCPVEDRRPLDSPRGGDAGGFPARELPAPGR